MSGTSVPQPTAPSLIPTLSASDVVRIWDGTRRAIESFDKSIADIRRFYLTVVMAIAAAGAGFSQTLNAFVVDAIGVVVLAFTLIFWGLDTHYHGYLRVAAATADRIERDLRLVNGHHGVTSELGAFRQQGAIAARVFHLIYIIPAVLALVAIFAIGLQNALPEWYWVMAVGLTIALSISGFAFLHIAEVRVLTFFASHPHHDPAGNPSGGGSVDVGRTEEGHRFDYIHGLFLTHYASFIASLFASIAWLAILWTQRLPADWFPRFGMGIGVFVLNGLALYFLTGILLYSRVITSRFVPGVVDDEIARMPDWERKGWAIRLAQAARRNVVSRGPPPVGIKEESVRVPPFFVGALLTVTALAALELFALLT